MVKANTQFTLNFADTIEVSLWRSELAYFSVSFLWSVCSLLLPALCPGSPAVPGGWFRFDTSPLLIPIDQPLLPGDYLTEGQSAALRACKAPTLLMLTRHRAVVFN